MLHFCDNNGSGQKWYLLTFCFFFLNNFMLKPFELLHKSEISLLGFSPGSLEWTFFSKEERMGLRLLRQHGLSWSYLFWLYQLFPSGAFFFSHRLFWGILYLDRTKTLSEFPEKVAVTFLFFPFLFELGFFSFLWGPFTPSMQDTSFIFYLTVNASLK